VFLSLWIAQITSNIGSWMQNVGAAWAMGDLAASATLVALVQTATTLPVFLVGIPAGALADIFDRRKVLIATQTVMLVAAGSLAAIQFADQMTPAALLGFTFLLGLGSALNMPAWSAIQPELVPRTELPQALALGAMAFNVGRAIGPAIGGIVVAAAGAGWVFLLNALSFLGIIVVLFWWKRPTVEDSLPPESMAGAMRAGLRYGMHSPSLRSVLVRSGAFSVPSAAMLALLPIVAREPLELGSAGYGLLVGCFGFGAAASAIVRPRLAAALAPDALMNLCSMVVAAALIVTAFVHVPVAVAVAMLFGGAAWTTSFTTSSIAAQSALPGWVRARGMGLYTLVAVGGVAVGSALWGVLAGWSLNATLVIAAVTLVVGLVVTMRWKLGRSLTLDLSPAPLGDPVISMVPRPEDGPVLVTLVYKVPAESVDRFLTEMRRLERVRRRTGAYQWGLYEDLAAPERFLETYLVESWAEHLRQRQRGTATDRGVHRAVREFVSGDVEVARFISPYGLHATQPDTGGS
jgi:MFS family permease